MHKPGTNAKPYHRGGWRLLATLLTASTLVLGGCVTWSNGIAPMHPRYGQKLVDDPPTLEWKPEPLEGAEAVHYDLVVLNKQDVAVYRVADLTEPRHVLTARLPAGPYKWTVRPVFLRNGQWEPGPWNGRNYLVIAIVYFQWGETFYTFKLPAPINEPAAQQIP